MSDVMSKGAATYNHEEEFEKPVYRSIVQILLTDTMAELQILEIVHRKTDEVQGNLKYESIQHRYGSFKREMRHRYRYRIGEVPDDYSKLHREILTCLNLLRITLQEFVTYGTYLRMELALASMEQMDNDDKALYVSELSNFRVMKKLKERLETSKEYAQQRLNETDHMVYIAKKDYETKFGLIEEKLKFINKWELSRGEQQVITIKSKEKEYNDIIKNTEKEIEEEKRVNYELKQFLSEETKNLQEQIEMWMRRYDNDMDTLEQDTSQLNVNLEALQEEHKALKEQRNRQIKEMADWKEYKQQRKEEEMERQRKDIAATRIQIWWRYMMLKHKLGIYNKKKGKGKGKGKDRGRKRNEQV